jgi:hypothetical protein
MSLLRRNSTEFNFKQFIEQFYHPVVSMLSGRQEPRINEEIQKKLHLLDLARTGDRYLYQNHMEIRIYGCDMAPYKLPKYVPVRIFSLEYIRKMINLEDSQDKYMAETEGEKEEMLNLVMEQNAEIKRWKG